MGYEALFQDLLGVPTIRVLEATKADRGPWTIRVESTRSPVPCSCCGAHQTQFHSLGQPVRLRHLPVLNQQVVLEIRPKRYRCTSCEGGPTLTEGTDWYDVRSPNTKAYDAWLLLSLVNSTVADTARKLAISEEAVEGALDRLIDREVNWAEFERLDLLGIDEIALRKGHASYVTIVTMPLEDGGLVVVAVLSRRGKETLERFFDSVPPALLATVTRTCVDMNEGYLSAIKARVPGAQIVIDRFHLAMNYRDAADTMRKAEMKRLKAELSEGVYAELKGAMWPLRMRWEDLDEEQRALVERVFAHSPKLAAAYWLREDLTQVFDRPLSRRGAKCALRAWIKRVEASGLTCFDRFVGTLERHIEEIANYFVERLTSGFVEGFNNKIKVLKRRCYGVYDLGRLFQRLTLDLEGSQRFGRTASPNI